MVGFYVGPEIRGNTLIDNVAQDNEIGFDTETYVDATLTLIGKRRAPQPILRVPDG
jgi:hypothetical protein